MLSATAGSLESLSYQDTDVSLQCSTESLELCQRLRRWVLVWKVSPDQVNSLLAILQDYFACIPTNIKGLFEAGRYESFGPSGKMSFGTSEDKVSLFGFTQVNYNFTKLLNTWTEYFFI